MPPFAAVAGFAPAAAGAAPAPPALRAAIVRQRSHTRDSTFSRLPPAASDVRRGDPGRCAFLGNVCDTKNDALFMTSGFTLASDACTRRNVRGPRSYVSRARKNFSSLAAAAALGTGGLPGEPGAPPGPPPPAASSLASTLLSTVK